MTRPTRSSDRVWTDQYERDENYETTYLDREPFRSYCQEISDIIHAADHALSIGDIHRELGSRAEQRWTADALEMIRGIEECGVRPTRYRPRNRSHLPILNTQKELNERLFAKA